MVSSPPSGRKGKEEDAQEAVTLREDERFPNSRSFRHLQVLAAKSEPVNCLDRSSRSEVLLRSGESALEERIKDGAVEGGLFLRGVRGRMGQKKSAEEDEGKQLRN